MTLSCKLLEENVEPAWDAFIHAHPDGSFFHLATWRRVIERVFGHATHYLYTQRDGAIVGVLPLARVKSLLFGHSLTSLPFCVYGGPLAIDAEALSALTSAAADLMRRVAAPVMEFRFRAAGIELPSADERWLTRSDLYVTFRKPFTEDDGTNLKAIPRKQRAMVRKGIDRGLSSVIDTRADRLHAIYAESVRNLGTPVFARRYFQVLLDAFGPNVDIVTVFDGETAIASVLSFYFRDEALPYYGGSRAIARECYGNDFMYWDVMRRAALRGYRLFDFGRSKVGTGSYAFKKNWGFLGEPLHYRFCLAEGATIPDTNPLNPKYRLFIAAWKRLPIPVANLIGPHIVRGVG